MRLFCYGVGDARDVIDVPGGAVIHAWDQWQALIEREPHWRVAYVTDYKPYENVVFLNGVTGEQFADAVAQAIFKTPLPVGQSTQSSERDMVGKHIATEDN